ncbi:hypothetical protein ACLKA6_011649 [Drosophila palustris]
MPTIFSRTKFCIYQIRQSHPIRAQDNDINFNINVMSGPQTGGNSSLASVPRRPQQKLKQPQQQQQQQQQQ